MSVAVPEPVESTHVVPSSATLAQQMEYAEVYSQSGLLPDDFRGKPANVLVAISLAEAMDESLLTITGNLTMVGNKPGWESKFMRQRARRYGHRIVETFDRATMTATCTIFRVDDPKTPITVVMDKARAQQAGWWGKGYWAKDPELMLKNRAVAACVREACNEVLGGVNYEASELRDVDDTEPPARDWWAEAERENNIDRLAALWREAHRHGVLDDRLKQHIQERKAALLAAAAAPAEDVVDAEVVDPVTGEVPMELGEGVAVADAAPSPSPKPTPIRRQTITAITRELERCGVDPKTVDAYLPVLQVPREKLADLTQDEGNDLLAWAKDMTRDQLTELMANYASAQQGAGS